MNNLLDNIYNFIHDVQKERGLVSLYLRSKDEAISSDLEKQFSIVNKYAKALELLPKKQSIRIEPFITAFNSLPAKRKYVTSRMLEPAEALSFYSRNIITPAMEIIQELAVLDSANHPAKVSAFINFLQWKERVGLERAFGTQLANINWSNITDFKGRLEYIVSEQQAYERMFMVLTNEHNRNIIEDLKNNNDTFKKIEKINQIFINGGSLKEAQAITAQEWFSIFTDKMDLLYEMGKNITDNLATLDISNNTFMPESSVNKATGIEMKVNAYMDTIQALPLFTGVGTETLQDILKFARIVSHNKGALIFFQGETASRFYIVMEGWVKLFKGNSDGQESVLQVMTTGGTILESVIFNNSTFPANAQAVDDVKLLSIPASIIREKLVSNKELAINMLSTLAGRSHELISQFEQLTLKTVSQRLGWFILKLFLDSGDKTKDLALPYDKSLIASYLGMKPETFSRTLQTLREKHRIDINRNTISLPDVFALCDYCDLEIAGKCSRHGTKECHNPDCNA